MDNEEKSLEYIILEPSCISKVAVALNTKNRDIKKSVYELLTALCAHNTSGYNRAMAIIDCYKLIKHERYRFKAVVDDLSSAETIDYQLVILGFINYVIMTPTDFLERIKIRNEFIGLQILPVFKYLRKVADSVDEIIAQLDVFEENRECDEAQNQQNPNGINLNSHLDIFYSILNQVSETPHEVIFLSILQHLLRIDNKDAISDIIWDAAEKMVHRATLLENNEDAARLLRTQSVQILPMANGRATDIATRFSHQQIQARTENINKATSTTTILPPLLPTRHTTNNDNHLPQPTSPPPPPPIPPRLGGGADPVYSPTTAVTAPPPPPMPANFSVMGPAPPPPPMPANFSVTGPAPPPPPMPANFNVMGTPPPPPPMPIKSTRPITPEEELPTSSLLPQQNTPEPKIKMKKLNWNKIPDIKVLGKNNIWTKIASNHGKAQNSIDFAEMEILFSNPPPGSPQLSANTHDIDTTDRKTHRREIISLLDSRLVLNTNIFIRQFRIFGQRPKSLIVEAIRKGQQDVFGLEKLQNLNKIITDTDFETLRSYTGDRNNLDEAVLFLMELMELSGFKLRAAGMLLKEEFNSNVSYLASCIDSMLCMGQDMMQNKLCEEILYLVVVSGNFINCGGYGGNAAGIRFSSLSKLNEVRSQNKNITLMHFIALQAKKQNPELLNFPHQFPSMEQATKTTVEQITTELNQLETRVQKIKKDVEAPSTDQDIKENMLEFLEKAQQELSVVKTGLKGLEILRKKLAEFFCEDETVFTLEECFKTFFHFCNGMKQATIDNDLREKKKLEADKRKKRTEDNKQAKRLAHDNDPSSPMPIRRRMGSCTGIDLGNTSTTAITTTTAGSNATATTPDLTPNGSLRRRINHRALPDEDELMQFLRTSGNEHISRERKAYGSLDRSWSRRSASRKRHELLNADFSTDRERANSPVPQQTLQQQQQSEQIDEKSIDMVGGTKLNLEKRTSESNEELLQQKEITKDATKPRISHLWRSKIETWLLLNEIDNKQNDEYKRKRRMANEQRNRRSLENDAESERKLQTLPEEDKTNSLPSITTTTTTGTCNNNSGNSTSRTYINEQYKPVYLNKMPISILERNDLMTSKATTTTKPINTNANNTELNKYMPEAKEIEQQQHSKALQAISEEKCRRSLIQKLGENSNDANEHIEMYVRRPRVTATAAAAISPPQSPKTITPTAIMTTSDNINIREPKKQETIQNDNDAVKNSNWIINNPPSTTTTTKTNNSNTNENDTCSFDRYAVERRTRRFKRAADNAAYINNNNNNNNNNTSNSNNEDSHNNDLIIKDEHNINNEEHLQQIPIKLKNDKTAITTNTLAEEKNNEQKMIFINENNNNNNNNHSSSGTRKNLEKIGRRFSSINQEDVQQAKRNLKSPTDHVPCDMRIWGSSSGSGSGSCGDDGIMKSLTQNDHKNISTASVTKTAKNTKTRNWSTLPTATTAANKSTTKMLLTTPFSLVKPSELITTNNNKLSNNINQPPQHHHHHHEQLNDEGFEETQSLVSDTPSHIKDSNLSTTTPAIETPTATTTTINKNKMPKLTNTKTTNIRTSQVTKPITNRLADRLQISKLRSGTTTGIKSYNNNNKKTNIINNNNNNNNNSNSQQSKVQRADVRRTTNYRPIVTTASGSGNSSNLGENNSPRQSLRSSSHSSINSANSINTVRRMPHNINNNNNSSSGAGAVGSNVVVVQRKNSNSSSISSGSNKKLDIGLKKPLKILQNYQQAWATTTMPMYNHNYNSNNRTTTTRPNTINRQSLLASTTTATQGNKMRKNNYHNNNSNRIGKLYNGATTTTTTTIATTTTTSSATTGTKSRNENAVINLASTSFKENQEQQTPRAINGFMRPTTSSATKRHN